MILILGGTAEGRRLASALPGAVHSLAGSTEDPVLEGRTRRGGFGGSEGLARFLRDEGVRAVIDATHPFAEAMTRHAVGACAEEGVPLLRVERPSWGSRPEADGWAWVDGHAEAAERASAGRSVLLTVGRQHTPDYAAQLAGHRVVARVTDAPGAELPDGWTLLRARGPFTVDGERALFAEHAVDTVVTKDAGGAHTEAKLQVAAEVGATVVMIRRPGLPAGLAVVASVDEALDWVGHLPTPS